MSKRGFLGKYGPLNQPLAVQTFQRNGGEQVEIEFVPHRDFPRVLEAIRAALEKRFRNLGADPKHPEIERRFAIDLLKGDLAHRLAFQAWQELNSVEGMLKHLERTPEIAKYITPEHLAEAGFWLGVLTQRVHLAPREEWRRLTPHQRQSEGARRSQRHRWADHNAKVEEQWLPAARRVWKADPWRTIIDVAREIAKLYHAKPDTVRRRIAHLKPAGQ